MVAVLREMLVLVLMKVVVCDGGGGRCKGKITEVVAGYSDGGRKKKESKIQNNFLICLR